MAVPTIALYASPPSSVCSTPHPCQINSHASHDFDLNGRSPSSSSTALSSQKPIVGGLSCLFSSPSVKHVSSSSYSSSSEELGSLWHDRGDELGSSFRYSSLGNLGSSLKRDQSPVSVFQGPVSCGSSGVGSSRSPPMRIAREKNAGDVNLQGSMRAGTSRLFNGFVRHALGSCVDYDPSTFQVQGGSLDVHSSSDLVDELPFNMEDSFMESSSEVYAKDLLLGAQLRHKIFLEDIVVKAFYEAEKAHRGQMRASGDPYLQHCVETAVLLAMIGANSTVVAAGLLHDTLDDSFMSYDYIFQTFGAGVADLVEGSLSQSLSVLLTLMASVLRKSLLSLFFYFFLTVVQILPVSADQPVKTYIFRVDRFAKPSIFSTHYHWYSSEFADPVTILHVYDTVFHGFSATLSPAQAASVLQHPSVLAAFEDRRRQLHTTRSPQFLGLRNQRGLWYESDYGSDVIIGVFDTGIWPERRSFSDLHLGPVPSRWKGVCQTGAQFTSKNCNKKIIGARFFSKGQAAGGFGGGIGGGINQTIEFLSPRDADGHGTHTASTAAGRYSFDANMSGYAPGIAKGVAPKARLAVYKVCWKNAGCFDSDILAAFDAAVNDGVNVISISIGGGDGISSPYYLDPIAIGAYGAVSRGVFVSSSAGNDGPNLMSVTNLAPWLTSVGAGTIDRNFPADVILGDGRKLAGVSLYAGAPLNGKTYPLVYPGKSGVLSASLCMENSLEPNLVKDKIVICDRGSSPRVAKGLVVKKAGGVGMILSNGASNGEGLVADAHLIPTCAVGADEGDAIKSYVASSAIATATINFRGTVIGIKPAPVVASFSGRGPNGLNPEILKPDLIAPGVNILAAWTDAVGPTGLDSDTRKTEFNILSGTSMACPHVSGAAALLKSAHPDWSPAAIRSAMMTTASITDNRLQSMTDEATGKPSTPYDFGAGHLNLDLAMDPGLVYDITNDDYVSFLCSIGYGPKTIQVITRSPTSCPMKRPLPENLNYPSISALFSSSNVGVSSKSFIRTATNVGPANSVYRVKVEPPKGVTVTVKPSKLVFSERASKLSYVVTVTVDSKNVVLDDSGAVFGSLSWLDGKHVVRSPIVVTQIDPL